MKLNNKRMLWVLLIGVVIASLLYANKSFKTYKLWQSRNAYFKNPPEDRKIEMWMTPRYIRHHYRLDKINALDKKMKFKDRGLPLEVVCEKRKLDCDEIVKEINEQIND